MANDAIFLERHTARVTAMSNALQEMEDAVAYLIDAKLDACVHLSMFTQDWASSAARNDLCRKLAREVVFKVVHNTDRDIPAEVTWLHGTEPRP